MEWIQHPFAPFWEGTPRVLILGTLPSRASRAAGFYYGHPRNRFWPLMARLAGAEAPAPEDISGKKALLRALDVALWDVAAGCEIAGSSDASIRNVRANDLEPLLAARPALRVCANGATAGRLYRLHCEPRTGRECLVLPSTSPANAAWTLPRLVEAWRAGIVVDNNKKFIV
ncbi:MAG: DNA-deoxyinosine glycosylase [Oscillospiraceae bacterium]|jgi:hypoxanthine-DNA glycosylase|nr:DNA-deoxyinosine glycosylase [Oscillospiraceae bacterium]